MPSDVLSAENVPLESTAVLSPAAWSERSRGCASGYAGTLANAISSSGFSNRASGPITSQA